MRKFAVAAAVLGSLAFAGGAFAGGRWMITSINQIKPSVRHRLQGSAGPRVLRALLVLRARRDLLDQRASPE